MRQVIFTLIMLSSTAALGDVNAPTTTAAFSTDIYKDWENDAWRLEAGRSKSDTVIPFANAPESEDKQPPILYNEPEKDAPLYTAESHPEEYCIALNIYYESRADNLAGRYAVADVVLNRTLDARFPDNICGVVYEAVMIESWKTKKHKNLPDHKRIYYPKKHKCQFSWYCDGKKDTPREGAAWRDAQQVASNLYRHGKFRGITEGATHYHATYVSPSWSLVYDVIGRVGEHIFYKWNDTQEHAH